MNAKERDEHETLCPHCGGEAQWSFLDEEKQQIEILCPDCGRYTVPREQFDQASVEQAQVNDPERP